MSELKMMNLVKKDMAKTVSDLNFDNFTVQRELIKKQLTLLNSLNQLYCFKTEHHINSTPEPLESKPVNRVEKLPVANERPMYFFERKVRGGFINEIDAFVPEGAIRSIGLEHGDFVYATPIEVKDPHNKRFRYELAKKGDGVEKPDRVQYNFCPVKQEAGRLVVEKSEETGEFIRYEENLHTIVLDEDDVFDHKLVEGSLIDVAFPVSKPNHAKVIWTHHIEENEGPAPKKSIGHRKDHKESEPIEQTLAGKTVLVIGNEPKKNHYKIAVEQRGGEMLWADAKDKLIRLESLVRKSDLVIFLLAVSGHVGMEHIKQMCKDNNVHFDTTWSKGFSTIVRLAEGSEERLVQ